jgi:hypothetical protein
VLVNDVLNIFIFEKAESGKHRIWRGLPQSTKRSIFNTCRKLHEIVNVLKLSFTMGYALQDFQHPFCANAAGRTLPA